MMQHWHLAEFMLDIEIFPCCGLMCNCCYVPPDCQTQKRHQAPTLEIHGDTRNEITSLKYWTMYTTLVSLVWLAALSYCENSENTDLDQKRKNKMWPMSEGFRGNNWLSGLIFLFWGLSLLTLLLVAVLRLPVFTYAADPAVLGEALTRQSN